MEKDNYLHIRIGQHFIKGLLDTGSFYSLISEKAVKRLRLTVLPSTPDENFELFAAEGSNLRVIGSVELCMNISGLRIVHTVFVSDKLHSEQLILGRAFMTQNNVILNYVDGTATIYGNLLKVKLINNNRRSFWQKRPIHAILSLTVKN